MWSISTWNSGDLLMSDGSFLRISGDQFIELPQKVGPAHVNIVHCPGNDPVALSELSELALDCYRAAPRPPAEAWRTVLDNIPGKQSSAVFRAPFRDRLENQSIEEAAGARSV